jgi:hypothetical protein
MSKMLIVCVAGCSLAFATGANACAMHPPPMPVAQLRQASDAIVYGRLQYGLQAYPRTNNRFFYTVGTVTAGKVVKGPRSQRFRINHEHMDTACQTWGWEPDRKPIRAYVGTFYLMANKDGTYEIARYSPKAER